MKTFAAVCIALAVAAPASAADVPPLTVTVSATPSVAFFGDPVAIDVHVLGDADPSSVRLEADAAPLERLGGIRRDESRGDVRFRFTVVCSTAECLGEDALVRVKPAALRVVARTDDDDRVTLTHAWPAISVARRVPPAALTGTPRFVVDDALAPVEWSVGPGLASVLLVLALVCAAGAAAILVADVLRRRGRAADRGDALARALAELRAALRGDERDRRRAAGRVARVTATVDASLSSAAAALAWSEVPPEAAELESLAARVAEAAR